MLRPAVRTGGASGDESQAYSAMFHLSQESSQDVKEWGHSFKAISYGTASNNLGLACQININETPGPFSQILRFKVFQSQWWWPWEGTESDSDVRRKNFSITFTTAVHSRYSPFTAPHYTVDFTAALHSPAAAEH